MDEYLEEEETGSLSVVYKDEHDWSEIPDTHLVEGDDLEFSWWVENNREDLDNMWVTVMATLKEHDVTSLFSEEETCLLFYRSMYNTRGLKTKKVLLKNHV